MISNFFKLPIHLRWYQIFSNSLYTSDDIKFFQTPYTPQMITNFFKLPIHLRWYQIFSNSLYTSDDIKFFQTPYTLQMISVFFKHAIYSNDFFKAITFCTTFYSFNQFWLSKSFIIILKHLFSFFVTLFVDISTFLIYLMLKPFL